MKKSKKILSLLLVALMAISMMPLTAFATDKAIEISGVGYDTLDDALAAVKNGETITLKNGTFESESVGEPISRLNGLTFTIEGNGAENTSFVIGQIKINGEGAGDYRFEGAKITFKNLKIQTKNRDINYLGFVRTAGLTFENCTFYGRITGWGNDENVIDGCTFESTDKYQYVLWTWGSNLTIKNTKFLTQGKAIKLYGGSSNLTIENCEFISNGAHSGADKPAIAVANSDKDGGDYIIKIDDKTTQTGFVKGVIGTELWGTDTMSDINVTKTLVVNDIQFYPEVADVAEIGGVGYETLADAIATVKDGETIKVIADIVETGWVEINRPEIDFTLDINGHKISRADGSLFDIYSKVTVTDSVGTGEISAKGRTLYCNSGADLTAENLNLVSTEGSAVNVIGCYGSKAQAKCVLNNCKIDCIQGLQIQGEQYGATAIVNGGSIDSVSGCVFYHGQTGNQVDAVVVSLNDCTLTCDDGEAVICGNGTHAGANVTLENVTATNENGDAIYHPNQGTMVINGGSYTGTTALTVKSGDVTINGGTFTATGAYSDPTSPASSGANETGNALYVEDNYGKSDYSFKHVVNVIINDGTFISENASAIGARFTNNEKTPATITIKGGAFASAEGKDVIVTGNDFAGTITAEKGIFSVEPKAEFVAEGKAVVDNDDVATKDAYPFMIGEKSTAVIVEEIEEEDIAIVDEQTSVETQEEQTNITVVIVADGDADETDAKEVVKDILNNDAVKNFEETKIDEAVAEKINVIKEALKVAATVDDIEDAIDAAEDESLSKYIHIDPKAVTVSQVITQSAVSTIKEMSFDVKPMVTTEIKNSEGEVIEKITTIIPNKAITSPLTFRLPVDKSVEVGIIAKVFHKGEFYGNYAVKEENGDKYLEIEGTEFSIYSYELQEDKMIGEDDILVAKSLTLNENIDVNFYVKIKDGTDVSDYTIARTSTATYGTTDEEPVSLLSISKVVNKAELGGDAYKFIADCAASPEMGETVNVKIYYKGVLIKNIDYSVKQYCINTITKEGATEKAIKLCTALLDYGTCAQIYFDENNIADEYVNKEYSIGMENISATVVPDSVNVSSTTGLADGIKVGTSVVLTSGIRAKVYFIGIDDSYTFTLNGESVSAEKVADGQYAVKTPGLGAGDLSKAYTFTASNGSNTITKVYSVDSYAYSKQSSTTAGLSDLVKALYLYSVAADAYFA